MTNHRVRGVVFARFSKMVVPVVEMETAFPFLDRLGSNDSIELLLALAIVNNKNVRDLGEPNAERVRLALGRISAEFQEEAQAFARWFVKKCEAQRQYVPHQKGMFG